MLRDYLTDLFPIMELGTSAKMLSIVPLMNGGGLFETGAGGSAPEARPAVREGEPPPLGLARRVPRAGGVARVPRPEATDNATAQLLADTLDRATGSVLDENRSPSRKVHELDNRGSHFYLALYWAQELAAQTDDAELAAQLRPDRRGARAPTRTRSSTSSTRSRGRRSTSAATTSPTTSWSPRPCARAPRFNAIIDGRSSRWAGADAVRRKIGIRSARCAEQVAEGLRCCSPS